MLADGPNSGTIARMEIVLASASPRRRELMGRVAPDFRVFPTDVDESAIPERDPLAFAIGAAVAKAKAAAETFPEAVVIGADTVVALGLRILGKPADREEARAMLRALSGPPGEALERRATEPPDPLMSLPPRQSIAPARRSSAGRRAPAGAARR